MKHLKSSDDREYEHMGLEDQRALRYKGTDREGNRASPLFEWNIMVAVEYILFQLFEVLNMSRSFVTRVTIRECDWVARI